MPSSAPPAANHSWIEVAHCPDRRKKERDARSPAFKFGPLWLYAAEGSGVWVNVGPLQWHRPTGLRLTFDELRSLIALSGLDVGRSTRVLRRVPYLASPRALASGNEHDCVFFVARAPAIVRNRTWWGGVTSR